MLSLFISSFRPSICLAKSFIIHIGVTWQFKSLPSPSVMPNDVPSWMDGGETRKLFQIAIARRKDQDDAGKTMRHQKSHLSFIQWLDRVILHLPTTWFKLFFKLLFLIFCYRATLALMTFGWINSLPDHDDDDVRRRLLTNFAENARKGGVLQWWEEEIAAAEAQMSFW